MSYYSTDATGELSTDEIDISTLSANIIDVQPTDDITAWFPWILLAVYPILTVGFIFNLITAVAFMNSSLLSKGKPVHQLIFNMTMSDLITCLVTQPFLLFQYTEVGKRFIMTRKIPCIGAVIGINIGFDSTVTALLLITCERLFAITSPLQHMYRMTRRTCRVVIMISWLLVTAKSAVLLFWNEWEPFAPCIGLVVYPESYGLYIYNPNLYVCMGLVVLLNIILGVTVVIAKRKAKSMNASETTTKSSQSDLKIVKIVFLAVGVLLVTWIPNNSLGNLIFFYIKKGQATPFDLLVAFHMTRSLALVGIVADPLIYFLQNTQCHNAVLKLLGQMEFNSMGCLVAVVLHM
ncbi:hypothetical protein CAPTEDRAFT_196249 [Capitella teleta]|uniref:G-protein coupled receptors family 1 profile domain-containing protein n=1 Tax=Capitella teleta TaxID=283909 RepID=R7TZJ1_CAPTE|nr:hypothetical protein CAPTEDRAFT_196249 [Capitella teleta]|eukprot:ELT99189.1 hypothetical protein CAPTEDRAFT_196249 [Capitella teleta]